jgi:hypothetical protein
MEAAAAQEGAKEGANWERRQRKRKQNVSVGSARGSKMGAAAAQEEAKWERRQRKREKNGSGGSPTGSKMGAAAAQEGAQEGAAAGAAWGAEASGLLGFWVWGRCF